jgi:formyl-CoA transferase
MSESKPLEGLLVLDLSRVLSGPFATQQLADLGAEIIKIEHPQTGDDTRAFGPPFIAGESTYFMSINRAKKSVAIDLKAAEGRDLVRALARGADVAIENFRPGTAERLGLGQASLRAETPRLVTCAISGYGSSGDPDYAERAGYDAVIQAGSGLMALTGPADGAPSRVGVAIADLVTGLFAAQGILAALVARGVSGKGRHVEVSMQDAMAALLTYQAGIYFATGKSPPRMGDAHPSICPYQSVATKDGIYMLAVGNDAQFVRLAAVLGIPGLADDPRFRTNRARVEHRVELFDLIGPRMTERTRAEWDRLLAEHEIPGGPLLDVAQALQHPQLLARGSILEHRHPSVGETRSVATPLRFEGLRPEPMPAAPLLGQHTREILRTRLGLDEARCTALERAGVIKSAPED